MDKTKYTLTVAGCRRELPICQVDEKTKIAAFIMLGDIELTMKTAKELLKRCPEHDVLITAEAKGIPLCYEMARETGKTYVVARKSVKLYMHNPVQVEVKSITTARLQNLYLSESDFECIKGKKVLIVDDVVSTGESLTAIETLVSKAGGNVVGKAAVLAEGKASDRDDLIFLESIPLFPV
jgi:Adenine/guanine phosphoribosyltransferases and related PRPP-binding proteins